MKHVFTWKNALEPIIKQAGEIVLSYYGTQLERMQKQKGFVTKADLASEQYLKEQLQGLLPEAAIIAEESGISGAKESRYAWVIDPLDGTTNFACGIPYFCISVALTDHNVPIVGAVYQPLLHEFFYAEQGKGAVLNDQPVHVSLSAIVDSVIGVGLSYVPREQQDMISRAQRVAQQAYAIRSFGAIALDIAYVAAGRLDGVVFTGLAWWDVAAGIVLVQEAGGTVTDFSARPLTPEYRSCIAGNLAVVEALRAVVNV